MLFPYRDNIRSRRFPVVTCVLIAANAVVYFASARLPARSNAIQVLTHGFIPARLAQLKNGQPIVVPLESMAEHRHLGQNVRLVVKEDVRLEPRAFPVLSTLATSLFLHGGLVHLLGNMWFLWLFGDNVEDRLGRGKFLAFYLLGGIAANLCHWWNDPASQTPVIGASGAVGAVLGAYAITFPWARIRCVLLLLVLLIEVELPALIVLGAWFLSQVFSARQEALFNVNGGVALWAHIGGFLFGMAIMPMFSEPPPRRQQSIDLAELE